MIATAAEVEVGMGVEDRLLTFEEFAELRLDTPAELVEGRLVEMSRNNPNHSRTVARLSAAVTNFVLTEGRGEVFAGDVAVITKRNPDTWRGADVAFVSRERWAEQPEDAAALVVAPDLIVEVISPSKSWDDVMAKLTEYFAIGVLEVWIATPPTKTVHVYRSTTRVEGHSREEEPVLPGFEVDLREIFGGEA